MTESQRQELDRDCATAKEGGLIFQSRVDEILAAKNHERGRHEAHVDCLLQLLRDKGIELGPEDITTLRRSRLGELPNMGVAMNAKDANHFMQQAGLR